MVFSPNDSPLAGREGSHLTGSKIGERLANEAATSVSLRVLPVKGGGEAFEVQARGELQLGLLIGESLCRASTTVHVARCYCLGVLLCVPPTQSESLVPLTAVRQCFAHGKRLKEM